MGNCLKSTKVDLESQNVDNSSGKINNKDAGVKFISPEFDNVFHIICQKQKKDGYYQVRQLSKLHKQRFEIGFESLSILYKNLPRFILSKYSRKVKYLHVTVEVTVDQIMNDLSFLSTKYLPEIKQVDVTFVDSKNCHIYRYYCKEEIYLNEPLILNGVNFINKCKNNKKIILQIFCGGNNIEILNSNFDLIALKFNRVKTIIISNSTIKNVNMDHGLLIQQSCQSGNLIIQNVEILNSFTGFEISRASRFFHFGNFTINNVKIKNCIYGCEIIQCGNPNINNVIIENCENTGFWFKNCINAKIMDCIIKGFIRYGINLENSSLMYKGIHFERSLKSKNQNYDFFQADHYSVFSKIL